MDPHEKHQDSKICADEPLWDEQVSRLNSTNKLENSYRRFTYKTKAVHISIGVLQLWEQVPPKYGITLFIGYCS